MTLADTTALLEETTTRINPQAPPAPLTATAGVALIDQWLEPLQTAGNLQPLVQTLSELKGQLQVATPEKDAIQTLMSSLAQQTSEFGMTVGSEGEFPALLEGLAAALRQASDTSLTDAA